MREAGSVKAGRAASLIFTLYGDFGSRSNGELPVGSLISLMSDLGFAAQAVRQALSRMVAQGWLYRSHKSGRSCYALTARGEARIAEVAPRIYEPATEWDGRWRIVVYGISERARALRDRLRKDLTLLGLAPLAPAVWISPRDVRDAILELAKQPELARSTHLFAGEYEGPLSDRQLLARCWDLERIAGAYREFIAQQEPRFQRERSTHALNDREAFIERLRLVQDFRKFLYIDPGLPSTLLPPHWPGSVASGLFRQYYALIAHKADRFFNAALDVRRKPSYSSPS